MKYISQKKFILIVLLLISKFNFSQNKINFGLKIHPLGFLNPDALPILKYCFLHTKPTDVLLTPQKQVLKVM